MYQMLTNSAKEFYNINIIEKFKGIYNNSFSLIMGIIDILIVVFLIYKVVKYMKNTRVWQLLKGIIILVVITFLSNVLHLEILNSILSSAMMYGGIMLIVVFQPELRRGLEQLRNYK